MERRSKLYVKSIELDQFRNVEHLTLSLDPGINILYGQNAQGKTNILEAVYLAGTTRSHRGAKDKDMIRLGMEESHIRMEMVRRDNDYRIDMHLRRSRKKGAAIDGVPVRKASELFGIASMVFFSPEDLNIIKNGPAERRRFLDSVISGVDRIYLSDLTQYHRCLQQRGKLLREANFHEGRLPELDVWDEQLAVYGMRIIKKRRSFLRELEPEAAGIHQELTGQKEALRLIYEPNTDEMLFRDRQFAARGADLKQKITSVGPHRDDFAILANNMDLRTFGSQGQQRTAALTLKLSEISIIEKEISDQPVLLLDDVLSELDSDRQKLLLGCIRRTQTLITCTGLDEFVQNCFEADKTFHIVQGGLA